MGGSGEHFPFRDKNTEAQKRERDFRGSAVCETKQSWASNLGLSGSEDIEGGVVGWEQGNGDRRGEVKPREKDIGERAGHRKRYRYAYLDRHRKRTGKPNVGLGGQWKGETLK